MRIAGIGEAGASVDATRAASVHASAPGPRTPETGTVRLVARIASSTPTREVTAALDSLPPSESSPARVAARTRAWLNETLDPLDRYVDGYPVEHDPAPAPSPVSPLGVDGVLA